MIRSICPLAWSARNKGGAKRRAHEAAGDHHSSHAKIDSAAARWACTPETLAPVICVVAEATATVGGMP